jgi:hypothetical protein
MRLGSDGEAPGLPVRRVESCARENLLIPRRPKDTMSLYAPLFGQSQILPPQPSPQAISISWASGSRRYGQRRDSCPIRVR